MKNNPNYYRLKQNQIDALYQTISAITPELLAQAQALEAKYNMNLVSGYAGLISAALFSHAKKCILVDLGYIAVQYKRLILALAEYQTPANDPDHSIERAEKLEMRTKINGLLDEFMFNNYADMLLWIKEKQAFFEQVQNNFMKQYRSYIGVNKGTALDRMRYDHLARLSPKKRKAYLQNFEMKRVKPQVQELYDCIMTFRQLRDEYRFDNNFLIALVHNFVEPQDKARSIQKLDNLFLEMDYDRQKK